MGQIRRWLVAVLWKAALTLNEPPGEAEPHWSRVKDGPIRGAELWVDLRDGASREMIEGVYDDFLFDAIADIDILADGGVAWDVGAHIGYHSLVLASLVGKAGRICAFEPNPYNVARFRRNMGKNQHLSESVELHECAVAALDGQLDFRMSPSYFLSSIGYLDTDGRFPSEQVPKASYTRLQTVQVPVRTMDSLLEEGLLPPSVVKIDVEGAEVLVLEGARNLLSSLKPALLIEVHNIQNMFLIHRMLLEQGYDPSLLGDARHQSGSRGFVLAI